MQDKNSWNLFMKTGSIKDYLQYCKNEEIKPEDKGPDEWVKNDARLNIGDGHGNQDGANWRIR